ncbi:hypothetical protein BSKO_13593 [Bryopsis sp. KO-2023]|nr:hypothetical protein BSKO_13593 [Bryopsis sp. KO-2023]
MKAVAYTSPGAAGFRSKRFVSNPGSLTRPRSSKRLPPLCGLFVPSDSFGGISPEKKAALALERLFTFCAVRGIMAQLEGSGRGALASYDAKGYSDLENAIPDLNSMDCDKWIAKLMKKNKMMALRVMEVRAEYCKEDFEWDMCKSVAVKNIKTTNLKVMRESMAESYVVENPKSD